MHEIAQEKGGNLTKTQQKQALGKSFGICRSNADFIVKVLEDFQVAAHYRKGRYVKQHQKAEREREIGMAKILHFAIHQLKLSVKALEKDLAKAFKNAKPNQYRSILIQINTQKEKINKVRAELNKRGFVDMDEGKLKIVIRKLNKETEGMNSEEKETYFRAHLMPYFSTATIRTKEQDLQEQILNEQLKQVKIQQDYLQEKLSRLEKVLKNVHPKDRAIILEEIEKIKKKIQTKSQYKNYSRSVKYNDAVKICDGCRKEKPLFYQKLCKECYQKRVKNYVKKYDTVNQDAFAGIRQKLAEKKERSIYFKPFRPLETLRQVTQTRGKLSSSNVIGMEYSDGMLKVTFNWEKLGEVEYGYDVGPDFYERMAKSPSKGKFVWSELRGKSPGYVIDNPNKLTPGGVGGSIVPYTKLTKRKIQGKEFKKLQKHYAGMLKGKVKVVAHMPFVRKKQKVISRESKPFKKSPGDFVLVKIKELSDAIPVKKHTRTDPRTGKTIEVKAFDRTGTKKAQILAKAKRLGKTELPKTKKQIKQEKSEAKEKATTQRRAGSEEQKRRREIEKQARGQKAVAPPEPREEAIQKLIEQTGMERSEAEKQIAKRMGLSPEQAKQKAETKQREEKFKSKNKELTSKILILKELNDKIQSAPLRNILKLFLKGFMLIATGKDPKAVLNKFKSYFNTLKKEKKLNLQQKSKLLLHITKIHKELESLSKTRQDYQYISAAVDKCAKQKMARAGEKGNYQQFVGECIRIIGISRRKAGLSRRAPGGTASEQRRVGRRERTQAGRTRRAEARVQRGVRREWEEAARIMGERREARRQQREERREALRREQEAQRREQERLNTLVEMKHGLERTLGEGNTQDARRVLQWMGTNIGLLREGEVKQRWQAQLEIFERRISRAEEERQRAAEERVIQLSQQREVRERGERARAEVRRRRQERNPRIRSRLQEAESNVSGLQESEAGSVMHIEIPQEEITPERYQMMYGGREPPVWAQLTPPAGMRQTRRGSWTRAGIWRNPTFRTAEQISQARERRRGANLERRAARHRTRSAGSSIRETPAERKARKKRRKKRGPKLRWRTRVSLDGRNISSLSEITRRDLSSGMRLQLNPVAKKDYDFENPDFNQNRPEREGNRRRITIRKGESAGIVSFHVNHHPSTGLYLYLGTLKMRPDFRGRGASSILKPAIMWADSQNMVIGGSPTPIGREQEVAPAHLSREEQRTWSHNNSRDLNNFYRRLEGEPNYQYGGSFARFPHPERIGRARSSDLARIQERFDQRKGLVFFWYPQNIAYIGGYHFYYDPEKDQFYQLETVQKGGKK